MIEIFLLQLRKIKQSLVNINSYSVFLVKKTDYKNDKLLSLKLSESLLAVSLQG